MATLRMESYKTKSATSCSIHLNDEVATTPDLPAEDNTIATISEKLKDKSTMELLQMLLSGLEHLETSLGDMASAEAPQM